MRDKEKSEVENVKYEQKRDNQAKIIVHIHGGGKFYFERGVVGVSLSYFFLCINIPSPLIFSIPSFTVNRKVYFSKPLFFVYF